MTANLIPRGGGAWVGLLLVGCSHGLASRPSASDEQIPHFVVSIAPVSMMEPSFHISGTIETCGAAGEKLQILVPKCSRYQFTRNGAAIDVGQPGGVDWTCSRFDSSANVLRFDGESSNVGKCEASGGEIYCLNHSAPNPEIVAKQSRYDLRFVLPRGYAALAPAPETPLNNGIAFHLAKLSAPLRHRSRHFAVDYVFPEGFEAEPRYLAFLEAALDSFADAFGEPSFSQIKVGAIRRDEAQGTISGSPAGNLILFSRTAFKDPPKLGGFAALGITADMTEPMRRLVIAHEASHLWFGTQFTGRDGWMVEGIPQYLALLAIRRESAEAFATSVRLFEAVERTLPRAPIPNQPLGDGEPYAQAYWQAPLALLHVGDAAGQDEFVRFIARVFQLDPNPSFSVFDAEFKKAYPGLGAIWDEAWRIQPSQ